MFRSKIMELPGMSLCLFWLLFIQLFQLSLASSMLGGNETDRLSLLAFKAAITDDPLGILSSWNKSTHFCEWFGVTCGRRHQRVTVLNLQSLQLVGGLTTHIGNLSFLRTLNLQNNSLINAIPHELGRLLLLEELGLVNNTFSGEIPVNISYCSNLFYLGLGGNKLTGKLPAELGSLSKLQVLVFYKNNLVGEIPSSFGNLSSLETITGTINNLHGGIPDSFGKLKMLKNLVFGANSLTGIIPHSIYNLSSITLFSTPFNQLQGSLPHDLGHVFPNLEKLNIGSNQFSGPIPVTISNASKLREISIYSNKFFGEVPSLAGMSSLRVLGMNENNLGNSDDENLNFLSYLVNCSNLEALVISDNNFKGMLPEYISNFSMKLRKIGFGRNQIHGSIPTEIGNLISLEALGLETNHLTGTIPSSIGKLQKLSDFFLNRNELSGIIPSSLGNMTSLGRVNLRLNNLQGSIPSSLVKCHNLLLLYLSQNNLSGTIPREIMMISSLGVDLYLSDNQLTGSIPVEVSNLANLGTLDVSNNMLSGEIPGTLGSCKSLENLFMEGNFLRGTIPQSLSSLRALEGLDLSRNNLSGQIPEFLGSFKFLEYLNLSFNDFEGEVPMQGVFNNASAVSLAGNVKLCGGISDLHLSTCSIKRLKKKRTPGLKLIIPIVFGVLLLTVILLLIIFYQLRKTKKEPSSRSPLWGSLLQVSYEDLLKATGGFSSDNLIGMGSFGSVYKGILDDDGMVVAVKLLNLQHRAASKSFMAECEALRNIRHRNLVKVITACSSIDFQGNDFKALVYDFMVNGSLEEWLHPIFSSDEKHVVPTNLNLLQRLNIAIDVASALEYLHLHCQPPIVHCDLKPSNVLLDGEMTGHVGDFGLARFLSETTLNISSNPTSSIGIRGSMGYTAPEYGMGSQVSTYGDVYSFGILLLEMFTGKKPTDEMFKDSLNLHNFVKKASSELLAEIADPVLLHEREEGDTSDHSCLISILRIGVACSAELPRERMNIGDVETQLHSIKNKFLRTGIHGQIQA